MRSPGATPVPDFGLFAPPRPEFGFPHRQDTFPRNSASRPTLARRLISLAPHWYPFRTRPVQTGYIIPPGIGFPTGPFRRRLCRLPLAPEPTPPAFKPTPACVSATGFADPCVRTPNTVPPPVSPGCRFTAAVPTAPPRRYSAASALLPAAQVTRRAEKYRKKGAPLCYFTNYPYICNPIHRVN